MLLVHKKKYKNDNELNMTIMTIKTKWVNYFLNILFVYLVAFVFEPHCRIISGLHDFIWLLIMTVGILMLILILKNEES